MRGWLRGPRRGNRAPRALLRLRLDLEPDREGPGRVATLVGHPETSQVAPRPRREAGALSGEGESIEADEAGPGVVAGESLGRPAALADQAEVLDVGGRPLVRREPERRPPAAESESGLEDPDLSHVGRHAIEADRRLGARVGIGIARLPRDRHRAPNDRVDLAGEGELAGLVEGDREAVPGQAIREGVVGVGIDRDASRSPAGDRVGGVGADPVPGHALAEVDLRLAGPGEIGDRDPRVGSAGPVGREREGRDNDEQDYRGQTDAAQPLDPTPHSTKYQPLIPSCRWEKTWQW